VYSLFPHRIFIRHY